MNGSKATKKIANIMLENFDDLDISTKDIDNKEYWEIIAIDICEQFGLSIYHSYLPLFEALYAERYSINLIQTAKIVLAKINQLKAIEKQYKRTKSLLRQYNNDASFVIPILINMGLSQLEALDMVSKNLRELEASKQVPVKSIVIKYVEGDLSKANKVYYSFDDLNNELKKINKKVTKAEGLASCSVTINITWANKTTYLADMVCDGKETTIYEQIYQHLDFYFFSRNVDGLGNIIPEEEKAKHRDFLFRYELS